LDLQGRAIIAVFASRNESAPQQDFDIFGAPVWYLPHPGQYTIV